MANVSGVEVPADLLERGSAMIIPILRQLARDRAAGRSEEFSASGIYQHAMQPDNPPDMVPMMLAAALVALGRVWGEAPDGKD